MTKQVSLFADTHDDEEKARNYQRFIETQNPDAVIIEATYGDGSDKADSIQDYRTMADVHEAFGADISQDKYQTFTVSEMPLYGLDDRDFEKLTKPVQNYIAEHYAEDADVDEAPLDQQRALTAMRDTANTINKDKSTMTLRLTDSAQFMDAEVMGIEKDEDRFRMFEYGASEINDLPDNPGKVKTVYNKITNGGQMEAQMIHGKGQIMGKDFIEGLEQLLHEYDPIREQNMAETIETTMEENDHETAAVLVGSNHVEGVHSELPDEWDVIDFELGGDPSKWSAGKI